MKIAYMAHPLGPDGPEREKNRANATKWFAWLHDQFPSIAFTANWVLLSAGWPETDEHRKRGLEIDMVHVDSASLIFFVGGRLSDGMLKEQARAAQKGTHQVDLTFMGYVAPSTTALASTADHQGTPYHVQVVHGMLRELDKALARITPLDAEQRELFNKELSERLSRAAIGEAFRAMNPLKRLPTREEHKVCTREHPCAWCIENGKPGGS